MTYVSNITELGLYLFTKSWTHHCHLYIKLLYFTDMIAVEEEEEWYQHLDYQP
jgi:hypothetical protein